MPRVVIDNREVHVPEGGTLLDAARLLNINIPTLCHYEGCRPNTSCMVCLVKLVETGKLVPSCATIAKEGMCVESETEDVRAARRTALELLLSDHAGECRAPCQYACPFDSDVPQMIRHIAAGRIDDAAAVLRRDVPLAGVLSCLAPDPSERGCRRGTVDEPVAIGLLKRYVADRSVAGLAERLSRRASSSGRRVAIVGGGAAGLSAAYFLLLDGHACVVFESETNLGGSLRSSRNAELLIEPLRVEIEFLETLGLEIRTETVVGRDVSLSSLREEHDVVLLATGRNEEAATELIGLSLSSPLPLKDGRLAVDAKTRATGMEGVFAAGDVVRSRGTAVRAAVDGKAVARCIDQFLRGNPIVGPTKLTSLKMSRPDAEELSLMAEEAVAAAGQAGCGERSDGKGDALTDETAPAEAARCLHCDCEAFGDCRLRIHAEEYRVDGSQYRGERRYYQRPLRHHDIVFEPGKCILCGLCVQITQEAGDCLGLTHVGRGFDVQVAVPFDESLGKALRETAARCVAACPTGALSSRPL